MKKVDVIIDLQYGSTGKGLIAGYLAETRDYDMVINANMPNAGHTYIDSKGFKMMHKVLPNGIVARRGGMDGPLVVGIGPGSVFDLKRLEEEMAHAVYGGYAQYKLIIHEDAVVLDILHKVAENGLDQINGSTSQGSAAAIVDKVRRNVWRGHPARVELERHNNGLAACVVTNVEWMGYLYNASNILLEGAQGYSLGINAGFYPFCTSRDCTPARFMSDCNVPLPWLRRVIGTARVHPIRVGGNSGPCYPDQTEITWSDLGIEPELTTVTQRVRRVFTWSQQQIEEAISVCCPTDVFLNFCNYDPDSVEKIITKIQGALLKFNVSGDVKFTGWGPNFHHIQEKFTSPCDYTTKEHLAGGLWPNKGE